MAEVHGFCDERFAPIGDAFRVGFDRGTDEGASLAVTMNGELVVDLWGGYCDLAHTQPWQADTVVPIYSTSKVIVAIAALMVWDRGLIDLDEPIATYWPEFAQNGKAAITTRQVLVYTSGLPGFGRMLTVDDVRDWDRMIGFVERAAVWHEPGAISCYHMMTFGYVLAELVQRVSGVEFVRFVAEEITGPLGADFHFALSAPHDIARVAQQRLEGVAWAVSSPMGAQVDAERAPLMEAFISGDLLGVINPSGSGVANARALARVGSIMALGGEVDGRRYLRRNSFDEAIREQTYAEDQIMGWQRLGLFFGLNSPGFRAPTPTSLHWGGYGGSWLTMDPASGIACAYTPSLLLVGDEWLIRQAAQWRVLTDVLSAIAPAG